MPAYPPRTFFARREVVKPHARERCRHRKVEKSPLVRAVDSWLIPPLRGRVLCRRLVPPRRAPSRAVPSTRDALADAAFDGAQVRERPTACAASSHDVHALHQTPRHHSILSSSAAAARRRCARARHPTRRRGKARWRRRAQRPTRAASARRAARAAAMRSLERQQVVGASLGPTGRRGAPRGRRPRDGADSADVLAGGAGGEGHAVASARVLSSRASARRRLAVRDRDARRPAASSPRRWRQRGAQRGGHDQIDGKPRTPEHGSVKPPRARSRAATRAQLRARDVDDVALAARRRRAAHLRPAAATARTRPRASVAAPTRRRWRRTAPPRRRRRDRRPTSAPRDGGGSARWRRAPPQACALDRRLGVRRLEALHSPVSALRSRARCADVALATPPTRAARQARRLGGAPIRRTPPTTARASSRRGCCTRARGTGLRNPPAPRSPAASPPSRRPGCSTRPTTASVARRRPTRRRGSSPSCAAPRPPRR